MTSGSQLSMQAGRSAYWVTLIVQVDVAGNGTLPSASDTSPTRMATGVERSSDPDDFIVRRSIMGEFLLSRVWKPTIPPGRSSRRAYRGFMSLAGAAVSAAAG